MFIQTQATPNPATLKFLPGTKVNSGPPRDFRDISEAKQSPLVSALFTIDGITGVFLGSDFISVTKDDADWSRVKPAVLGAIMDHFLSGLPVIEDDNSLNTIDDDEFFDKADSETVEIIKELLDSRVRPAVAMDGGDIIFKGFKDGIVFLKMQGACSGCPSSSATLKNGIENLLRHFVPDVEEVQQI